MNIVTKLLAGLLLVIGSNTFAGLYTDTVDQQVYLSGMSASTSYSHDLTDMEYWNIVSGNLSIDIWDDNRGMFDTWETSLVLVEDFDGDTGGTTGNFFNSWSADLDFGGDLEANALLALTTDGYLDITITSLWGDFYVGDSVLNVITEVSEPASIALLTMGLMGVLFSRRRSRQLVA